MPTLVQRASASSAALEVLLEIRDELRGLRADLARQRPAATLSRSDRAVLARLLPAIAGTIGSELFLTSDLFDAERAAFRIVLRGLNARQVGRLLRRAVGTPIAGLVVERVATEGGAVLWRVSEFLGNENLSVPGGHRGDGL